MSQTKLAYSVVDAFTSEPFAGNPAAVVFGGQELPDAALQRIAAEFNLSETVFLLPAQGSGSPAVRLRWFTPRTEVSFCGHATLAAVHALAETAGEPVAQVAVECAAGNLVVRVDDTPAAGRRYWLTMPPPELTESAVPADALLHALRMPRLADEIGPIFQTRDHDLLLLLANGGHVRSLVPDMAALERLSRSHGVRGICVASTDSGDPSVACISRFFAPAAGIPEDPVTGSVHGPLAAMLIGGRLVAPAQPNRWRFRCLQVPGNGRAGEVHVRAESRGAELAIEVGGCCATVMKGQTAVPLLQAAPG
jgi:PhzF family phenazine biosynthesis protein